MRKYEHVWCPTCCAAPGHGCMSLSEHPYEMLIKHKARMDLAAVTPVPDEPGRGVEPLSAAYKTAALPLSYPGD